MHCAASPCLIFFISLVYFVMSLENCLKTQHEGEYSISKLYSSVLSESLNVSFAQGGLSTFFYCNVPVLDTAKKIPLSVKNNAYLFLFVVGVSVAIRSRRW